MSPTDVITRPPSGQLPISRGGDLVVKFRQLINSVETDYAPNVTVTLVVEVAPRYLPGQGTMGDIFTAVATIEGSIATCKIESNDADTIPKGSYWRCVVSYPTIPTTEVVAYNGVTDRADY